jgi:hypothetical protein
MHQAPDDWFLIAPAIACFPLHARFVIKPQLPHPPLNPPRRKLWPRGSRPLGPVVTGSWPCAGRVLGSWAQCRLVTEGRRYVNWVVQGLLWVRWLHV